MLHMFLVILKIIGIILAFLLGLLVVLVFCVLFLPVHYRVQGSYHEKWKGKARIHYLGPVLWLSISYAEEFVYRLRICGITVMSGDKDSERKQSRNFSKKTERTTVSDEGQESEELLLKEEKQAGQKVQKESDVTVERSEDSLSKEEPSGLFDRIMNWKQTIIDRIHSFWKMIKDCFRMISNLKEACEDERVKTGFGKVRDELRLLLKKIKPRRLKWYVRFGMEDPADTGCVLAVLGILQGLWGHQMYVKPDFEQKLFETEFQFSGFIQGFRLIRFGWKLYFDKDIQYLIEKSDSLRRS